MYMCLYFLLYLSVDIYSLWKGCLLSKVVVNQRSSSIKGRLPSKVVFRQRSSPVKGRLLSNVVFRQRSSSVKCRLPGRLSSKVVFFQRSSSVKGHLPLKVIFHQRSSSIEGRLPPLGHFYFWVLVLSVASLSSGFRYLCSSGSTSMTSIFALVVFA